MGRKLRNPLSEADKEWLRNWNRAEEIPENQRDEEPEDEGDDLTPYEDMTVPQLRAEIDKVNANRTSVEQISKGGSRADLIERLEEVEDEDDSDEDEGEDEEDV